MRHLVVLWLHLLGVAVWLGGFVFTSHLVVPALARGERACAALLRRGRVVGWVALGLVVVTGFENLRHVSLAQPWVMAKLVLLIALLALAAHRDFALVPRIAAAVERGDDPAATPGGIRWLDRLVLALAVVVLFLGVGIARSH